MKKLIAILAVMVVLAGVVFAATESHTVRDKSDVTEVLPAFNLYHKTVTKTNSSVDNVVNVTTGATYDTQATNANATDIDWNRDASGAHIVEIVAEVINNVKTNSGYKLTFKGGVFEVTRDTAPGVFAPTQITVANGDASNVAISEFGQVNPSDTNNNVAADADLSAYTTVKFSGTTGAGATEPIRIATATYHYAGDPTIDPSSSSAKAVKINDVWFYVADITLEITAN